MTYDFHIQDCHVYVAGQFVSNLGQFVFYLQSWTKVVETLPEKDLFC